MTDEIIKKEPVYCPDCKKIGILSLSMVIEHVWSEQKRCFVTKFQCLEHPKKHRFEIDNEREDDRNG